MIVKIAGVAVSPLLKHMHTCGWQVFALHSLLAANKSIQIKIWGVSLTITKAHLVSINASQPHHQLVLSSVSCHFDDFFEQTQFNWIKTLLPSAWQRLLKFELDENLSNQGRWKLQDSSWCSQCSLHPSCRRIIIMSSIKIWTSSNFLQMRHMFCQIYPWQHIQRGRIYHRGIHNQKRVDFDKFPNEYLLVGLKFSLTDLVGVCHWSLECDWQCLPFWVITRFLP